MDTLSAFIVVALVQAPFLGFLFAELFRFRGRNALSLAHFPAALVSFCLGLIFFGGTYGIVAGVAFAAPAAICCALIANRVAAGVRKQLALAPRVSEFALRNYDRLDPTPKGISSAGLHTVLSEKSFSADERELIEHMASRMSDIGRVTDTYFASAGGMHGGAVVAVYSADRNDLRSYESRLREKYARWIA